MVKIKNTGGQPRGFITEGGEQVIIQHGEEREFNMTEADFKNLQKVLDNTDDPKPFEVSGSHGGVEAKKKEKPEVESPAQSTEPPPPGPHVAPAVATNVTGERRKEEPKSSEPKAAPKKE